MATSEKTNASPSDDATPLGPLVQRLLAKARASGAEWQRSMTEVEVFGVRCMERLAADLGDRYSPRAATLETFGVYHANQRPVIDGLLRLRDTLAEHVRVGAGIVLYGTVGTGKDHLLAAMLYAAAALPTTTRWINGQELFGSFRDRIDTGQRDEDQFRELCAPQVLGISDPIPPVGQPGAWDVGNLYRLLDRRYRSCKSTWVSLNAGSVEDADDKLSQPVFDRLRDGAEIFRCFWPSYRERKGGASCRLSK